MTDISRNKLTAHYRCVGEGTNDLWFTVVSSRGQKTRGLHVEYNQFAFSKTNEYRKENCILLSTLRIIGIFGKIKSESVETVTVKNI